MLDTFSVVMVGIFDFGEFDPVPVFGVRLQIINN
jgi:hypothetical protein